MTEINHSPSILYAEDDFLIHDFVIKTLEQIGFKVTHAASGHRAFDIFQESPQKFDLILTDYNMPGLDGVRLSRMIRRINPDVKIILWTGQHFEEEYVKLQGINALLSKSAKKDQIAETIYSLLKPPPK